VRRSTAKVRGCEGHRTVALDRRTGPSHLEPSLPRTAAVCIDGFPMAAHDTRTMPAVRARVTGALCGVALGLAVVSADDNWPRFRGADGGVAADHPSLPDAWGPTQNIVWKIDVPGRSWSSPVVWGDHVFIEERTIDVHVKRLREALTPVRCAHLIETVRGAGYRLSGRATELSL